MILSLQYPLHLVKSSKTTFICKLSKSLWSSSILSVWLSLCLSICSPALFIPHPAIHKCIQHVNRLFYLHKQHLKWCRNISNLILVYCLSNCLKNLIWLLWHLWIQLAPPLLIQRSDNLVNCLAFYLSVPHQSWILRINRIFNRHFGIVQTLFYKHFETIDYISNNIWYGR